NGPLVELWCRVLRSVARSRLVLKALNFSDARLAERVAGMFAERGIEAERVRVLSPLDSTRDHLSRYSEIDIALDPYPYHGTTTTCEALLMGVPVVSLAGDRHASRVGATILHQVGLDECVATSEEDYVRIATGLASDA